MNAISRRIEASGKNTNNAQDFGAVKLPAFDASAPRFIIADEAAKRIFFSYLKD